MKNKNIPIENLLNQIYNEPDLGQEVFEYIAPHVLKAYEILKITPPNNTIKKTNFFSSEEDKINLETILVKNLPNIVDIYTKLPIEYRNTHVLKTGNTHRQTLLKNIQTLVKKMQEIEKEQYANLDTEALVNTKVINQKYKQEELAGAGELEKELELKTTFNFDNFKKMQIKETKDYNGMLDNFKTEKTNDSSKNNKKIKIVEGEIKYAVKNKMKHFMNGVYNAYNKCELITQKRIFKRTLMWVVGINIAAVSIIFINTHLNEKASIKTEIVEVDPAGSGLKLNNKQDVVTALSNYIPSSKEITESKEDNEDKIVPTLDELSNYFAASSKGIRDINMKLLEKYAKTHSQYNFKLADKGETIVVSIKTDKKECLSFVNTVNEINDFGYQLNNVSVDGNTRLLDDVADIACEVNNTIKLRYDALAPK